MLDDTFQDLNVDFTLSIGLDHAGLQVKYQHVLDAAIEHEPHCTAYLINNDAKDLWMHHLTTHSCYAPFELSTSALIDQEVDCLTQEIEETCQVVFEKCKVYSLRAAAWWDEECSKAAATVHKAPTPDAQRQTHKALVKEVQAPKHRWANDFLHNAMPEHLWTAIKWQLGCRQRLIPALTTSSGLTDDPPRMAEALQSHFFKTQPHPIPEKFPDDLPPTKTRPFTSISTAEVADALQLTSNKSAPGPLGHNYKLIKWTFATQVDHITWIFNACLS
jgi:hypothetical protein